MVRVPYYAQNHGLHLRPAAALMMAMGALEHDSPVALKPQAGAEAVARGDHDFS